MCFCFGIGREGELTSFIYLVKGPGVVEAAVPNIVDDARGMCLIFACRPVGHGQRGSPPHALLQLGGNLPLASGEELSAEATLSRQRGCADLYTTMVSFDLAVMVLRRDDNEPPCKPRASDRRDRA